MLEAADLEKSCRIETGAREVSAILDLDAYHVGAQNKLDIVQRKISKIEEERAEKARREKEVRERIAVPVNQATGPTYESGKEPVVRPGSPTKPNCCLTASVEL